MKLPSFFALFRFVIRAKARLLFTGEGSELLNAGRLILVLLLVVNAVILAIGYDYILNSTDAEFSAGFLQLSLQLMVVLTVVIAGYFPTMKPKSEFVKPFYPVNSKYILILNHAVDIFRPVYLYTLISLLAFYIYSAEFHFENLLITLLWMYAAILTDQLVKTTIYKSLPQHYIAIALFMTILMSLAAYFVLGLTFHVPGLFLQYAMALMVILVSCMALFIWSASGLENRAPGLAVVPEGTSLKRFEILLINLFFRRKTTVLILAVVPVIKVLLLVYLYYFYYRLETGMGSTDLVYSYMLMTPALVFTYVHNNLAGFFREAWLSHELCSGSGGKLVKAYTITLFPVWFYDFSLSVISLYIIGLWSWKYLGFYFGVSLILYLLGMNGSVYYPRFIDRFISLDRLAGLKNNTSGLMSFYCGLIMIGLAGLIETDTVILFMPAVVFLLYFLYRKAGKYSIMKFKMYGVLFRQK
ncbi:MAG: hypothetical protein WD266_11325 [Balneolales bacterium]